MTSDGGEGERIADLRGFRCPLPVLKTRVRLRAMAPGERIVVLTDDPLAGIDIPCFCRQNGQPILEQAPHGDDADAIRFVIERREGKL